MHSYEAALTLRRFAVHCLAAVSLSGLLISCERPRAAASPPPPPPPPQTGQVEAIQAKNAEQDKQIEAAIKAKLAKSKIGKDGFAVRVQGGVAYWTGSTSVLQHKGAATRMAKTSGARLVVNNIQVSDEAKQKAADNLTQGPRPAQLKRSEPRSQQ